MSKKSIIYATITVVGCILVAFAISLFIINRNRDSDELVALRNEPIITWLPASSALQRTKETDRGTALGKRHNAEILQVIQSGDKDVRSTVDLLAQHAKDTGWKIEQLDNGDYHGEKQLSTGRTSLSIYVIDELNKSIGVLLADQDN